MKKAMTPLDLRTTGTWGRPIRVYPTWRIRR